ncbi:MAG: rhodanese-like domain-containing protein, partial [Rhizobiales bacterium]|nr:rhodanese-like domain-containing protein [Hyphomicrobiales bacterium]
MRQINRAFTRRFIVLSGLTVALASLLRPIAVFAADAAVTKLSAQELAAKLAAKDFFFVNVHIPYAGEIDKTDAFIPFDKIAENLSKFPADKAAAIVIYCRSGRMSDLATKELVARGYT